jgi:hypothetical protein
MPNQKFKATVFVPGLTDFSSIVEIDVNLYDSEDDVIFKLIKKLAIINPSLGLLLSKKAEAINIDWSKLVSYEKIMGPRSRYGYL